MRVESVQESGTEIAHPIKVFTWWVRVKSLHLGNKKEKANNLPFRWRIQGCLDTLLFMDLVLFWLPSQREKLQRLASNGVLTCVYFTLELLPHKICIYFQIYETHGWNKYIQNQIESIHWLPAYWNGDDRLVGRTLVISTSSNKTSM